MFNAHNYISAYLCMTFNLRAVTITIEHAGWGVLCTLEHRCLQPYCIRPDQLNFLFCINHLMCARAGGHYSLLVTSKHYIHSEIYSTVAIKSGHVTARKLIMTVEVADLRGRG